MRESLAHHLLTLERVIRPEILCTCLVCSNSRCPLPPVPRSTRLSCTSKGDESPLARLGLVSRHGPAPNHRRNGILAHSMDPRALRSIPLCAVIAWRPHRLTEWHTRGPWVTYRFKRCSTCDRLYFWSYFSLHTMRTIVPRRNRQCAYQWHASCRVMVDQP